MLIDATCVPADIRQPTDLSLLNEASEVTEILIGAMHYQVREDFRHKPHTHRKQARRQEEMIERVHITLVVPMQVEGTGLRLGTKRNLRIS